MEDIAKSFMEQLIESDTPEEIDALFDKIEALEPAARDLIVAKFNAEIIEVMKADLASPQAILELKGEAEIVNGEELAGIFNSLSEDYREFVSQMQRTAQVMLRMNNLQGEGADKFLKTYCDQAAKMSDSEYNSMAGHMQLMVNTAEAYLSETGTMLKRTNPFRKDI